MYMHVKINLSALKVGSKASFYCKSKLSAWGICTLMMIVNILVPKILLLMLESKVASMCIGCVLYELRICETNTFLAT